MSKVPNQVLLKWPETHEGREYWYVIRRGSDGGGYRIEGYWDNNTSMNSLPQFHFPYSQGEIAAEFKKQGKEWRMEEQA